MDDNQDTRKKISKEKQCPRPVEASSSGSEHQKTPETIAACPSQAQTHVEGASQSLSSSSVRRRASVPSFGLGHAAADACPAAHTSGLRRSSVASTTSTGFMASSKNLEDSVPVTRHVHRFTKVIASRKPSGGFVPSPAGTPTPTGGEVDAASDTAQPTLRAEKNQKAGKEPPVQNQSGSTQLSAKASSSSTTAPALPRPASPPIMPVPLIKTQSSISESSGGFVSAKDLDSSGTTTRFVHGQPKDPSEPGIFSRGHSWTTSPSSLPSPPAEAAQPVIADAEADDAAPSQVFRASDIFSREDPTLKSPLTAAPLPAVHSAVAEAHQALIQAAARTAASPEDQRKKPGCPTQENKAPQTAANKNAKGTPGPPS